MTNQAFKSPSSIRVIALLILFGLITEWLNNSDSTDKLKLRLITLGLTGEVIILITITNFISLKVFFKRNSAI